MNAAFFFGHRWKLIVVAWLALPPLVAQGQPANDNFTNRFQLLCQPTTIATNSDATFAIAAGDLNNDGRPDVVAANIPGRIRLYLNNGTLTPFAGVATRNISADTSNTWALAMGDVNNDGWQDVIAGNVNGQRSRIYTNNRTADPFNGVSGRDLTTSPYSTFAVALADVNGDTNLDLILGNGSGGTAKSLLLLNNGTADPFAGVTPLIINTNSQDTRAVAVADVNGDNRPDVILGNYTDRVRLFTNNGTANPFTNVPSADISTDTGQTRAVVVGDVNNDNRRDVIVARLGQPPRLYLNNGTITPFNGVTGSNISADTNQTTSLALADVNGDTRPDLIAGNQDQRNRVYLNNGTANPFNGVAGLDVSLDALPTLAVALADCNGDGRLDLIDGNLTKTNRLYLNYGGTNPFGILGTSVLGDNFGATKEAGETNHVGKADGKSVWWTWTAPGSGSYRLDTIGSDFDTLLAVYTGSAVGTLTNLAGDDDAGGNYTSFLNFNAVAGTTYQIAVAGYGGASGNYKLNLGTPLVLTCVPDVTYMDFAELVGTPPNPNALGVANNCGPVVRSFLGESNYAASCQTKVYRFYQVTDSCGRSAQCTQTITVNAPINDLFANRLPLNGVSLSTSACNAGAALEPDEPYQFLAASSIWWSWYPGQNRTVRIDTRNSNVSTWVVVYGGNTLTGLFEVANSRNGPDAENFLLNVNSFTDYQIAVYTFGNSGNISLSITPCDPPVINSFNSWTELVPDGIALNVCASVSGATSYEWTLDNNSTVFTTSSCHTFLLSPTDQGNHNVSLIVRNGCGFDGEPYTPPATCAICLSRGTPNLLTGTAGSASGIEVNTADCGAITANARWFKMIITNATDSGWVTLSAEGTTNNTTLAVYTGDIVFPDGMTRIGCNNSASNRQSRVTINAQQGQVYWIALDPKTNYAPTLRLATGFEPRIDSYRIGANKAFEVFSTVAPPISYTLEMTTNLANPVWSKVQTTNASAGYPYLHFRDPTATNAARRFYRMKSSP